MSEEWVDLVDAQDRVVGRAPRSQVRAENLLHRSVAILCRNHAGQIYVHQRTTLKDVFPSMHDMFVGGVVASGESYEQAATREISEELGITGPTPQFLFMHRYEGPHSRALIAVYQVVWDGPIVHQQSEVAWGRFFSPDELQASLQQGLDVVPDGLSCFAELQACHLL